jgi:hypothetical protein
MDPISDEEFFATPLNVLANDHIPTPDASRPAPLPQSRNSEPQTPYSTSSRASMRVEGQIPNSERLQPERSLEFDNLRQIKHADPYGRITLGRRYSCQSFIVEELTQGALLLRPAVILEKRCLDQLRYPSLSRATQESRDERPVIPCDAGVEGPTPPQFLRIPTMR